MKLHRSIVRSFCLGLCIFLSARSGTGMTGYNQQAKEWYQRGMAESTHEKRAPMLVKAIQFDPAFIDAYYQLGLSYKSLKNYTEAEKVLLKAYSVKTDQLTRTQTANILFELGGVYLRLGRMPEAEGTLQSAKDAAAEMALKAKISFELGRVFAAQSKNAEAVEEFKIAKIFDPQNAARYDAYAQSITVQPEVADAPGESAVKDNKPVPKTDVARPQPPEIANHENQPGGNSEEGVLQALYDQARKYENAGNRDLALSVYQNIRSKAPDFRDVSKRLAAIRESHDRERTSGVVEAEYTAAMEALRRKNWVRAINSFGIVIDHDRNYRDARSRLREARRGLDDESADEVLSRYYTEGLLLMKSHDYAGAYTVLKKVRGMSSNYRNVASLLDQVTTRIEESVAAATETSRIARIDSLRRKSQAEMQVKDWEQAIASLDLLRVLVPEDEDVLRQYIQAQLHVSNKKNVVTDLQEEKRQRNDFAIGAAVGGLVLLLLIGGFFFRSLAQKKENKRFSRLTYKKFNDSMN